MCVSAGVREVSVGSRLSQHRDITVSVNPSVGEAWFTVGLGSGQCAVMLSVWLGLAHLDVTMT